MAFTRLKDWSLRKGAQNKAGAIAMRANYAFFPIRDAQVYALVPPAVQALGNATGFDIQLEDRGNLGHAGLIAARNQLLGLAAKDPLLAGVRPNSLDDTPQLHIDIDQAKAGALGISLADINSTLSAAWGSTFINDFIDRGRVKRVYMQADAPYRMSQDDLNRWYVRGANGSMAPFSSFATASWRVGPAALTRYTGGTDGLMAQLDFSQAVGPWLDVWGRLFVVPRNQDESDNDYYNRIVMTLVAGRVTPVAILIYLRTLGITANLVENFVNPSFSLEFTTPLTVAGFDALAQNLAAVRPAGVPFLPFEVLQGGLYVGTVNFVDAPKVTGGYLDSPVKTFTPSIAQSTNNSEPLLPTTYLTDPTLNPGLS